MINMEFVNVGDNEKYLPTGTSSLILDKIDTEIVVNGLVKGYICSNEHIPIFIGYMNFGLPGGCFDEYCEFLNMDVATFSYNNENIYVNLKPIEMVNVKDEHIQPYISFKLNDKLIKLQTNTTGEFTIFGENFDNYVSVGMGSDIMVNEIKNITPTSLTVNYTTYDNMGNASFVLKRGTVSSFGLEIYIEISDTVMGTGIAGDLVTDFHAGGVGVNLWGSGWILETFGNISNPSSFFKSSKKSTPSNGTGPVNVSQFTNASYYAFTERSSSNNGTGQYATVTTANFSKLTYVEFEYHLSGTSSVVVKFKGYNTKTMMWDTMWEHIGTPNHVQNAKAIKVIIPNIDPHYDKVQFFFGESVGWSADLALCNILIRSI